MFRRARNLGTTTLAACGLAALALPAGSLAEPTGLQEASDVPAGDGTLGPAAQQAIEQGYLVPDQSAYEAQKAAAEGATSATAPAPYADTRAPVEVRDWDGIFNTANAPSDSTSAVGASRFIELINRHFAIYKKSGDSPIDTGTLNDLVGASSTHSVFDPQIIWDATTRRFYYAADQVVSSTNNRLAFGWSTDATPDSEADWCTYVINYGSEFPDYPKLGDSKDRALIGVNTFPGAGGDFIRSDAMAIEKPPAGPTCPDAADLGFTFQGDLENPGGTNVFTPVAVNEIDKNKSGWFVARSLDLPATFLSLHKVKSNPDGTSIIQDTGKKLTVSSYTAPADAPQTGTTRVLDTLDSRPMQAVGAIDPAQGSQFALWTQHTVNGSGGRSEVRWYEIEPTGRSVLQSGVVNHASLFAFNGAISPNRSVNGSTTSGGDSMVLGFNTSSSADVPRIKMVSKIGAGAQSGHVTVHTSPGSYIGFDCAGADISCRWGDYSAATPDPTANQVWLTSMYASGATSTSDANWRTRNWVATP